MDDKFELPSINELLLVLVGLVAHKEGILEDDSTWFNYSIGSISDIENKMKAAAARGAALIAKDNQQ